MGQPDSNIPAENALGDGGLFQDSSSRVLTIRRSSPFERYHVAWKVGGHVTPAQSVSLQAEEADQPSQASYTSPYSLAGSETGASSGDGPGGPLEPSARPAYEERQTSSLGSIAYPNLHSVEGVAFSTEGAEFGGLQDHEAGASILEEAKLAALANDELAAGRHRIKEAVIDRRSGNAGPECVSEGDALGATTLGKEIFGEDHPLEGGFLEVDGSDTEMGVLGGQRTDLQAYAMHASIEWVLPLKKAAEVEEVEVVRETSRYPLKRADSCVSLASVCTTSLHVPPLKRADPFNTPQAAESESPLHSLRKASPADLRSSKTREHHRRPALSANQFKPERPHILSCGAPRMAPEGPVKLQQVVNFAKSRGGADVAEISEKRSEDVVVPLSELERQVHGGILVRPLPLQRMLQEQGFKNMGENAET